MYLQLSLYQYLDTATENLLFGQQRDRILWAAKGGKFEQV